MKHSLTKSAQAYWLAYLKFIKSRIQFSNTKDSHRWSGISFIYLVAFAIPFYFVSIGARVIYSITQANYQNIIFEPVFLLVLAIGLLHKTPEYKTKKAFYVLMSYIFSLNFLFLYGTDGPGVPYLILAGVFCAVFYDKGKAYITLLVNLAIILFFSANQHWMWFPSPISHYSLSDWLSYGLNLLFVNLVTIFLIRRVISRLEQIIQHESKLLDQIAHESLEIATLNSRLNESDSYYRYLFASNPIPMYVLDTDKLHFLQVNDAMVRQYGYSREEFLNMSILEIRPASYTETISKHVLESERTTNTYTFHTIHQKKDKTLFPVEIRSNPVRMKGSQGKLVLASDITDRAQYIQSIEDHNKRLRDIAWIQSHHVRAPLARIMSLIYLLKTTKERAEHEELISYLETSADELNTVITKVIRHTEYNVH